MKRNTGSPREHYQVIKQDGNTETADLTRVNTFQNKTGKQRQILTSKNKTRTTHTDREKVWSKMVYSPVFNNDMPWSFKFLFLTWGEKQLFLPGETVLTMFLLQLLFRPQECNNTLLRKTTVWMWVCPSHFVSVSQEVDDVQCRICNLDTGHF